MRADLRKDARQSTIGGSWLASLFAIVLDTQHRLSRKTPHTCSERSLAGKALSPEVVELAAEAATVGARPLRQNGYKTDLVRGAVR